MSRRHAWLTFVCGGPVLPLDIGADRRSWQHAVRSQQSRWYAVDAPPQVAAAFVLQWILQVPAHAAAYASAAGPWRAHLSGLTFTVGASLVPAAVRLARLVPDDAPMLDRLERAERVYRSVAEPAAAAYPSVVRLGPHTRAAMVDDMWTAARREAESAAGLVRPGLSQRESCCLIYALPGCVECAGCPRLRDPEIGPDSLRAGPR